MEFLTEGIWGWGFFMGSFYKGDSELLLFSFSVLSEFGRSLGDCYHVLWHGVHRSFGFIITRQSELENR
jgi:hypothetical protein